MNYKLHSLVVAFLLMMVQPTFGLDKQFPVYPIRPTVSEQGAFTFVVIPDPQSYVKFDANQPLFELQTAWIADNVKNLNIKNVLCTGDLVEQNEERIPDGENGNQTSDEQWQAASKALERLDNRVPYIICPGNHDYGYRHAENRLCHLGDYFKIERNPLNRPLLVSVYKNAFGVPTLENAAYEMHTDTWGDMLIVSLEFAPRDEVLAWAKDLCDNKYKNHTAIVLTHMYLDLKGNHKDHESYTLTPRNWGDGIWEKLVQPTANIRLVVCGHECSTSHNYADQVSYREDLNKAGKKVAQMMFNSQCGDFQWHGNGGDCWLRFLEFMPDGKTIKVRTFSPLFGISPITVDKAWRRGECDEFNIVL